MDKQAVIGEKHLNEVEVGTHALSDTDSAAEVMVSAAVGFAADKMRLSRAELAIALKQADAQALSYFDYGLARQLSEYLAALDENTKAVYMYDDEATADDQVLGENTMPSLIHLIVVARRKTKALTAMIDAIDRALVQRYAALASLPHLAHLLDVQIADEQEVKNRSGLGALLASPHHQPLPVWPR